MAEISASLVKELREKTGAGMMDCKKALAANDADIEAAIDWLRKKGLAAAAKKAGRVAAEGLVAVVSNGTVGALVEVNAETDFVARNEQFQAFVKSVATLALASGDDVAVLKGTKVPSGKTLEEELTSLVATVGEHMDFRRAKTLSVSQGVVATYMHSAVTPGLGKIGILVGLESSGDVTKLAEVGKQIAMHVAAANPQFLSVDSVDSAALERERSVLSEQAAASGKPPAVIEKMVEGRIRKYYEEVVLLEQLFVIDGETKISKVVENAAKAVGAPVKLTGFVRFALGEGIEKEQKDFAAEVAAQLGH
ncbi:translation elongation factor Ts [Telmatospirillum sp.]|uniref:translation elongation factor Ts n=1 Tax=Telmatospirillum sp. TaxID=2079197 RepID=UPI002849D45B|nr:translation elongation factor Ts [Telmatospirillum sp.]MDR3436684.1 translation elongation factor Ts [Telmatospirillum sp.]